MNRPARYCFLLLSALLVPDRSFAQDTVQVVTDWLRTSSVPIRYTEPDRDFSDLRPLREALAGVQVVGLGEATHGTREIFTMKHRLVAFLVKEMGFTALAIESSYSNCEPINAYILTGKGDRNAVLTGQGYTAWDNEEFLAMLDWLKDYNQTVPREKKVRFYGLDVLSFKGLARKRALAYIRKYAPEKAASTDSLFHLLEAEEYNWPSRLNQSALGSALMPLHETRGYFAENKKKLVAASSLSEWEQVSRYLEVIEQGLFVLLKDVPPSLAGQKLGRDDYQWQNLQYLMGKERPNTRFIISEHNFHVSYRPGTLGTHLRQALGDKYYSLATQIGEGTFQARVVSPDGFWGELKADTVLQTPTTLGWYFTGTRKGNVFLNLRHAPSNPIVDTWLHTPIRSATGNWQYRNATQNFGLDKIGELYDGIVFLERSTPVHPTKNALARSALKIGF